MIWQKRKQSFVVTHVAMNLQNGWDAARGVVGGIQWWKKWKW